MRVTRGNMHTTGAAFNNHLSLLHLHLRSFFIIPCHWTSYRPQRSCGQSYVFTRVCDSVHRGVCLSACWEGSTPKEGSIPGRKHPRKEAPPEGSTPPAYGLRAAGTHPTGMHSSFVVENTTGGWTRSSGKMSNFIYHQLVMPTIWASIFFMLTVDDL